MFDFSTATTTMQYIIGGSVAMLPALVWGYLFYKQSPQNKRMVLLSFLAGGLAIIPMMLWRANWSFSFDLFGINIPHINLLDYVKTLSLYPTWDNLLIFIIISIIISFCIYLGTAIVVLIVKIFLGANIKTAFKNITHRSVEEPFIFISTGVLMALLIVAVSILVSLFLSAEGVHTFLFASFWGAIMIGFLEEFTKHLVVRFSDDDVIISIDSAIEFSIIVALGFSFLENAIYFVDKIWLSSCSQAEIAQHECLLNPETNTYAHQVGVLLIPYIYRSVITTISHVIFSGLFGYFYGLAHFASYELQEMEKSSWGAMIWGAMHQFFRLKKSFVYHEMKIFQGLFFAMFFHGIFNFFLDQGYIFLTAPMIVVGILYLLHLLHRKENQKKLRLLTDTKTSKDANYKSTLEKIEMLKQFEAEYLDRIRSMHNKDSSKTLANIIHLLNKYYHDLSTRRKSRKTKEAMTDIENHIQILKELTKKR